MSTTEGSRRVIFLMGPTGAGKTAIGIALARQLPVEIISVDSAMVYRGLDIGTAKPSPITLARTPHHLIDICDPQDSYSAARFRDDALGVIDEVFGRGNTPLLVGGTGLYFRTLEHGIAELPAAAPEVRESLARQLGELGAPRMHEKLAAADPRSAARSHPNDPQRILRALEVYEITATPMSVLIAAREATGLRYPITKYVVAPAARGGLHRRLAQRFRGMLEAGFINEVAGLLQRPGIDAAKPAMRSVGYREVCRYLRGELLYAELVDKAVTATRRLAKRQYTWFRGDSGARWLDPETQDVAAAMLADLRDRRIFAEIDYT